MIRIKEHYTVYGWFWNHWNNRYEKTVIATRDTFAEALAVYDAMEISADLPQVELWFEYSDGSERMRMKDSAGEYADDRLKVV